MLVNNHIAKGNIEDGKKEGLWTYYNTDSSIKQKGHYKNGLREGLWEINYNSGSPQERVSYINGIKQGYCQYFHYNGKLWHHVYMRDNNFYGLYIEYDDNGNILDILFYDNIFDADEVWIPLTEKETKKINKILNKEIYHLGGDLFYMIGNRLDFIVKLEDDYYYFYHNGIYTKCDQLNGLLIELKNI